MSIAGQDVGSRAAITALLDARAPGDVVEIRYVSRGVEYTRSVALGADPGLTGRWVAEGEASAEQQAFRAAWKSPTND